MKFNAFDYFNISINQAKGILLPFNLKKWLKLAVIAFLGGRFSGSFSSFNPGSFNRSFNGGSGSPSTSTLSADSLDSITGKIADNGIFNYPILYAAGGIILLMALLFTYITSVFSFVFLDVLATKKVEIKKKFKDNGHLGFSLFKFRIIAGILFLILIALTALPVILYYLKNPDFSFSLSLIANFIITILLFIFILIIGSIFFSLINNFSVTHMYFRKSYIIDSIKTTFKAIFRNKLAVFVFLLARLLINIGIGIAVVMLTLIALIPLAIIFGIIALIIYLVGKSVGWGFIMIAVAILIGIAVFVCLFLVMITITMPFEVFSTYFTINNYKALVGKKVAE